MIYSRAKKYEITSLLKELQHIPTEKETLNIPMDMFDLSVRASNALAKAGIKTISDFIFLVPRNYQELVIQEKKQYTK